MRPPRARLRFYAPGGRSEGRDRAPTPMGLIPERRGGAGGPAAKLELGKGGAVRPEIRQPGAGKSSEIAPRSLPRQPRPPPNRRAAEPQPAPLAPLSTVGQPPPSPERPASSAGHRERRRIAAGSRMCRRPGRGCVVDVRFLQFRGSRFPRVTSSDDWCIPEPIFFKRRVKV